MQFLGSMVAVVLFAYLLRPKRLAEVHDGRSHEVLVLVRAGGGHPGGRAVGKPIRVLQAVAVPRRGLHLQHIYRARRIYGAARLHRLAFRGLSKRLRRSDWQWSDCIAPAICRWIPRVEHLAGILLWFGATLDLTGARTWVKAALPPC